MSRCLKLRGPRRFSASGRNSVNVTQLIRIAVLVLVKSHVAPGEIEMPPGHAGPPVKLLEVDHPVEPVQQAVIVRHHDQRRLRPRRLARTEISTMRRLLSGSRLPVGSSARIISGLGSRARQIATRCFSPCESWSMRRVHLSPSAPAPRPAPLRASRTVESSVQRRIDPIRQQYVLANVEVVDQLKILERRSPPCESGRPGAPRPHGPPNRRPPASTTPFGPARSRRPSNRSKVVLPEPLGPTKATFAPDAISNSGIRSRKPPSA